MVTTVTRYRAHSETVTAHDYDAAIEAWTEMRTEALATLFQNARRRLNLPYFFSPDQAARIERDAIYRAQCDNWDAIHPAPVVESAWAA